MWFHAGDLVVSFGAEVNDEIRMLFDVSVEKLILCGWDILAKRFSHADAFFDLEAQLVVECDDALVAFHYLQVDLHATFVDERAFSKTN